MSLPPGFELDPVSTSASGLPPGFEIDQPHEQSGPDWLRGLVQNDPNTKYGTFLPTKTLYENGKPVKDSLALPESMRGLVRGTADLMDLMKGNYQPMSSDEAVPGSMEQPLTNEAMGTVFSLAMLHPGDQPAKAPKVADSRERNIILKNLELGDVTPQQYAEKLVASTSDDFAGELGGEPLKVLTQTSAKLKGPAMQRAREAMRERLATAPQRTGNILGEALGPQSNFDDAISKVDDLYASENALYGEVNGSIPRKDLGSVLNTPAGQSAEKAAQVNMANWRTDPAGGNATLSPVAAAYGAEETIPIRQAHAIARQLGDMVKRDNLTGNTTDAEFAEVLRKEVINKLRAASPEFDAAQTNAANARGIEDALSRGRKLAGMVAGEKTDDVLERIALKPEQQPYSVSGFHQGLLDKTSKAPLGTGNPAATIANQTLIDKATELVGADKAKALAESLMKEKSRMELANKAIHGSNSPETLGQIIPDLPTSPIGMKYTVVNKAKDMAEKLLFEKSNRRIAEALYATSPEEKKMLADVLLNVKPNATNADKIKNLVQMLKNVGPLMPQATINAFSGSQ